MKPLRGIAIGILAAAAWGQNVSEMTPRQIFDFGVKAPPAVKPDTTQKPPVKTRPNTNPTSTKPVDKPPVITSSNDTTKTTAPDGETHMQAVTYTPLALRYSMLQKKGDVFQEVDADTEFHSGDRIRVRVEANGTAYLYIVMKGSSGQSQVLFPNKDINGGNNRVTAGRPFTIPPENEPPFYFDENAGVEKVSLVLTRAQEPDLETLIYAAGDPTRTDQHRTILAQNKVDDSVLGGVRDKVLSRDLVFEKYDGPATDGSQEKAVYAATRDKSPNARLFVDLSLKHK